MDRPSSKVESQEKIFLPSKFTPPGEGFREGEFKKAKAHQIGDAFFFVKYVRKCLMIDTEG